MSRLTREQSRAQTRAKLVEAARLEIAGKGYEGASVACIAEAAGYTKGAFFAHFANKEAIVLELLRQHKAEEMGEMDRILADSEGEEAAMTALKDYLAGMDIDTEWVKLDIELGRHAARTPSFAPDYERYKGETRARLARSLVALFDKIGKLPPATPEDLADLFLATIHGLVLQGAPDVRTMTGLVALSIIAAAPGRA